jgi:hypothetical protein
MRQQKSFFLRFFFSQKKQQTNKEANFRVNLMCKFTKKKFFQVPFFRLEKTFIFGIFSRKAAKKVKKED